MMRRVDEIGIGAETEVVGGTVVTEIELIVTEIVNVAKSGIGNEIEMIGIEIGLVKDHVTSASIEVVPTGIATPRLLTKTQDVAQIQRKDQEATNPAIAQGRNQRL